MQCFQSCSFYPRQDRSIGGAIIYIDLKKKMFFLESGKFMQCKLLSNPLYVKFTAKYIFLYVLCGVSEHWVKFISMTLYHCLYSNYSQWCTKASRRRPIGSQIFGLTFYCTLEIIFC